MVGEIDGESVEMRRSSCRMRQRASLDEECALTHNARREMRSEGNRGMNRRRPVLWLTFVFASMTLTLWRPENKAVPLVPPFVGPAE